MKCDYCGNEYNGRYCPNCGSESNEMPDVKQRLYSYLFDEDEEIKAVLGNNVLKKFISTGVLGNGFAFLTNRRIYFRGKCLIRRGKGFYGKTEEKAVDLTDVTGTGFVHNRATWAHILSKVLFWVFVGYGIFMMLPTLIMLFSGAFVQAGEAFVGAIAMTAFGVLVHCIFKFIYKRFNYSVFEISYAGGGIAFDMHWITEEESREFQRAINLLKDEMKSKQQIENPYAAPKASTGDQADQLLKYKSLLDQGVITQEEFEQKKKQLLNL